ncbi:MAG: glutaryl-CoA dehydrogenase, partial [Arthrobacter pascens]|nr:glutaryl-CoA dehydrogenase [Arthrobacter pascens]
MPVQPQGRDSGQSTAVQATGDEVLGHAPPFPDADLMYIADLLPPDERKRYLDVREFLQARVRAQSIDYWNREEFPFGLLAEMGKRGLGGLQTDGTSKLFKGLMYVEVARADVSLSALVGIHN